MFKWLVNIDVENIKIFILLGGCQSNRHVSDMHTIYDKYSLTQIVINRYRRDFIEFKYLFKYKREHLDGEIAK